MYEQQPAMIKETRFAGVIPAAGHRNAPSLRRSSTGSDSVTAALMRAPQARLPESRQEARGCARSGSLQQRVVRYGR